MLAPIKYIQDYYELSLEKAERFPREIGFYRSFMSHINGASVLNVGCGPQFYDDLRHFGEVPQHYVGIDVNENAFKFMEQSQHPQLIEAKNYAQDCNVRTELIAGSVFEWAAETDIRFDSVFGVGVFGTFGDPEFHQLMSLLWRVLNKGGKLVVVSWDGSRYTAKQAQDKLNYRFTGTTGPTPEQLINWIEKAGFELVEKRIMTTDPEAYKWESIHVSAYRKGQDPG